MAFGGAFHIGTFFLFAATVLLVIVSVSSPIWNMVGFLKVDLPNNQGTIYYGNWGWCATMNSGDICSDRSLGYRLSDVVNQFGLTTNFSGTTATSLHNLSRALILHPIAAAVSFLGFLTAASSHRIGYLFASLIAFLAGVITLVALVINFVEFGIVKNHVNGDNGQGFGASYSVASWLVVAAFASLVLGTLTACCGCFTGRRRAAREAY